MEIKKLQANSNSYGAKRDRNNVKYIVIHYTAGNGDTAENEAKYFKNSNTRSAGAHFFVDQKGEIYKSVPMNLVAWSVGGFFTQKDGAGSLYKKCTNSNSVSIELCDNLYKDPSVAQIKAVKFLIKHIQKNCPNATEIVRHWDVNGKACPLRMAGKNNQKWNEFKKKIV